MRHSNSRLRALSILPPAVALVTAAAVATPALAQTAAVDPRCTTSPSITVAPGLTIPPGAIPLVAVVSQDACQKSIDLFNYLAPQLGALVAGSGAELGRGGTLGGLGRFDVGLRANVLGGGRLPDLSGVQLSYTGAQRTNFAVRNQVLALPAADVGVGLFRGVPLGLTTVGGLDLLLTGAYVPSFTSGQIRVGRTGGAVRVGYGARLGLFEQSRFVPGVGLTYLRRELPTTSISGVTNGGDSVGVRDARVRADSWRLSASYRVAILGLVAGVGQDRYHSRATVAGVVLSPIPGLVAGPFRFAQDFSQGLTRGNVYGGATLPLAPFVRVAGEVGRVSGGTAITTYNAFSGRTPTDAYTYASVGLRVGR